MAPTEPQTTRSVTAEGLLEQAVAAMRGVVGDANVSTEAADLDRAGKATIPDPKRPAVIVFPGSASEVAAILRVCAQHKLPVWPVSTGRNWGYGSATAVREGSVLLRLARMNRILEVNERMAYAVIEPGVTYRQLRSHLDANHPDLWCDTTDGPPEGSVIGNALDRGLGVTHYGDHFATLCGMEVVLPTGEVVRTGGGARGLQDVAYAQVGRRSLRGRAVRQPVESGSGHPGQHLAHAQAGGVCVLHVRPRPRGEPAAARRYRPRLGAQKHPHQRRAPGERHLRSFGPRAVPRAPRHETLAATE